MVQRRKDNKGRVLKDGESQRKDGTYQFRWTDRLGKRNCVYARKLEDLRQKEGVIQRDELDGIKTVSSNVTVNYLFKLWVSTKRGVRPSTISLYTYRYHNNIEPYFGKTKINILQKVDVVRYYNYLAEEKNLAIKTIENINAIFFQIMELAVDNNMIRNNPVKKALTELKRTQSFDYGKKRALTMKEQDLFVKVLNEDVKFTQWKTIFTVMLFSGLRVGECTGLRWEDIDFEKNVIKVNHTLTKYHDTDKGKFVNRIHDPKTKAGLREVPMLECVREAFLNELNFQKENNYPPSQAIDGYKDFVFIGKNGKIRSQLILNKVLKQIIENCNRQPNDKTSDVTLPHITCHSLRHTFATRMCEAGVNFKVIQETLGHSNIQTTLNIYTDATEEKIGTDFRMLNNYLKNDDLER